MRQRKPSSRSESLQSAQRRGQGRHPSGAAAGYRSRRTQALRARLVPGRATHARSLDVERDGRERDDQRGHIVLGRAHPLIAKASHAEGVFHVDWVLKSALERAERARTRCESADLGTPLLPAWRPRRQAGAWRPCTGPSRSTFARVSPTAAPMDAVLKWLKILRGQVMRRTDLPLPLLCWWETGQPAASTSTAINNSTGLLTAGQRGYSGHLARGGQADTVERGAGAKLSVRQ